jgi:single-stranded DNA-binding protein
MSGIKGTEMIAAGRLNKDAEIRYLSNGMEITQFGFFFNVEVTDSPVDLSEILVAGRNVLVKGPLNVRAYTHRDSGEERLMFQVAGRDIYIVDNHGNATPISELAPPAKETVEFDLEPSPAAPSTSEIPW